ncbi:DUF47 domain-containing protein [Methanolacinia petrolearia]|uniref:DUF47 domain-containing protein n=1 Tax=Methanolacinia petrolearia TaxID=54120 RepID=UPI003BAA9F0C
MTFFDWLVPKDDKFYDSISLMMEDVNSGINLLSSGVHEMSDLETMHKEMREVEHRTEKRLQEIKELLETAFITPIDPVEINEMVNDIKSMIHLLVDASTHIYIFGKDCETTPDMEEAVSLLKRSMAEMESAFAHLKEKGKPKDILPHYMTVKEIEKEVYLLNARATHRIYTNEPLNIIKYGKIYGRVCDIASLCEARTGAIYDIAVRQV